MADTFHQSDGIQLLSTLRFYRVLRKARQLHPCGRTKSPQKRTRPTSYQVKGPNEVWSWNISSLHAAIKGQYFYLFLVLETYSRKVVGWKVRSKESDSQAATLIQKTCSAENFPRHQPLVLHTENGSAMKGQTLRVKLRELEVEASFARAPVSNDNRYSEAIFRTCEYLSNDPHQGFATLEKARQWTLRFVRWYNGEHRHRAIRLVTPQQRHQREDPGILANRDLVYKKARSVVRDDGPAIPAIGHQSGRSG